MAAAMLGLQYSVVAAPATAAALTPIAAGLSVLAGPLAIIGWAILARQVSFFFLLVSKFWMKNR
jgi:hypothetical protein